MTPKKGSSNARGQDRKGKLEVPRRDLPADQGHPLNKHSGKKNEGP